MVMRISVGSWRRGATVHAFGRVASTYPAVVSIIHTGKGNVLRAHFTWDYKFVPFLVPTTTTHGDDNIGAPKMRVL